MPISQYIFTEIRPQIRGIKNTDNQQLGYLKSLNSWYFFYSINSTEYPLKHSHRKTIADIDHKG